MKKVLAVMTAFTMLLTTVSSAMVVKTGGATVKFTNNTGAEASGIPIVALYEDGEIKSIKTGGAMTLEAGETAYGTVQFDNYSQGSTVGGFFWNNISQMVPMCNKLTLTSALVDDTAYTGDYILAVNTDISEDLSTGTLPVSESQNISYEINTADDGIRKVHTEPNIILPKRNNGANYSVNTVGETNPVSVGDEKTFNLVKGGEYSQNFVCKAVGDYCYIWVANEEIDMDGYIPTKDDGVTPLTSLDIVSDETAKRFADEYDKNIYPMLTENFGNMTSFDDDIRVSLLFYDIQDGYNGSTKRTYTGGFFNSADLFSKDEISGATGNVTDMMHIDTYPMFSAEGYEGACSTIVHEMQHFINYSWLYEYTGEYTHELWTPFNEAMSMAAEHIYQGTLTDRIAQYNYEEYLQLIQNGISFIKWEGSIANYSMSYLFGQYLRTQTQGAQGGGNAIYKSIMDGLESYDFEGLTAQVSKVMYADKDALTPGELIANFRLALILRDDFGPFGFQGEAPFELLELPVYSGDGKTLPASGAVLIKNDGTFTPSVTGTNMKFYGITLP